MFTGKKNDVWGFYFSAEGVDPCVELTNEQHMALFDGQGIGKVIKWREDGTPYLDDPPPPTMDETQARYTAAIQARLDGFAQTRGYDSIHTAATYANSTDPQFRAEGEMCLALRDATWRACYAVMGAVLAGQRPLPSLDDLLSELPPLVWPETEAISQR